MTIFTLNETSAIVGYLEDTFPRPTLQPNCIRDRAPGDRKGGSRFDLSGSAMEEASYFKGECGCFGPQGV
jgi:hypothetical protein